MITSTLPLRPRAETAAAPGGGKLRAALRFAGFLAIATAGAVEWVLFIALAGKAARLDYRAAWLQRLAQRLRRLLGLEVRYRGEAPRGGLLVCNHLSYLDVVALAARQPLLFVAKREVQGWPGIGRLVACAGTIFIDRERRSDVVRVGEEIQKGLAAGITVCVFAEGTSSDGSEVLPFCSSLLGPAVARRWPVTPAWLGYSLEHGSAAEEVCFWREMDFLPHFLNLLTKGRLEARVRYGATRIAEGHRKVLTAELREEVVRLGAEP